jgi:conjugal transfer ATP-binding protein TraC
MAAIELKLFEASPAWALEQDTLIGYDLSFTQGLQLRGLDAQCLPHEQMDGVSRQLGEALCQIPADGIVRFYSVALEGYSHPLDSYVRRHHRHPLGKHVAKDKAIQCKYELAPLRQELYCFVSTAPAGDFKPHAPRLLSGRKARRICSRAKAVHEKKLREVTRLQRVVAHGLEAAGVRACKLSQDDLFDVVWRLANPSQAHHRLRPQYRPEYTLRTQLFSSGIRNFHDCFVRDGRYHRVLSLKLPPSTVTPRRVQDVLQNLPFQHQLVVTLRRVSEQQAERRLLQVRSSSYELKRMLATLQGEHKAAALQDHEANEQQRDAQDALDRIKHGERLFEVGVQLWLSSSKLDRLDRQTEKVRVRFRELGMAEVAIEELRGRFAYLSMLPGHHSMMGKGRLHPMLSSRAADLLPVFQAWSGAAKPTAWLTTHDRELVGFHPFEFHPALNSWNAIISASTGSGKSFITKVMLQGWVAGGGGMVVVTMGRDYHRFAELLDGSIYDVSLSDPDLSLGPFPTAGEMHSAAEPQVALEHLSSIIEVMTHEPRQPLDRVGRHLIYRAVEKLYKAEQPSSWAPTFADWLEALQAVSEPQTERLARKLGAQMRFWTEGPYGAAFNRSCSGNHRTRLQVWNLQDIHSEDVRAVVLALISGNIAKSIKAGRTVIVMDEVWSVLKSETGAQLVESLYRTVRKEGSSVWSISQSVSDYTRLPEGCRSALLGNAQLKLILAHTGDDIPQLGRILNLNQREQELAASVQAEPGHYSDVLLLYAGFRQLLRLSPCPTEYWLATSHKPDCDHEQRQLQANPDKSRLSVLLQLADQYPRGVEHGKDQAA